MNLNQGFGGQRPVVPLGREVIRVERRRLPNGRVVEFTWRSQTIVQGNLSRTTELIELPYTDDGCAPVDMNDVYACMRCGSTVTGLHARTCCLCGLVTCSRCLTQVALNGIPTLVCNFCSYEMKATRLSRFLRWLLRRERNGRARLAAPIEPAGRLGSFQRSEPQILRLTGRRRDGEFLDGQPR